jgi:hypothetical protein
MLCYITSSTQNNGKGTTQFGKITYPDLSFWKAKRRGKIVQANFYLNHINDKIQIIFYSFNETRTQLLTSSLETIFAKTEIRE